jgi:hypothetical protein
MNDGLCPKCYREMMDGEVVITDWAGNATQHVTCPVPDNTFSDTEELCAFDRAIEFEEALEILKGQG